VATRFGLALDHLLVVPDLLLKAANYRDALRKAGAAISCPDYEALAKQVQVIQRMLATHDVKSADVLSQLQGVTTALTVSHVQAKTTQTQWWGGRMTDCTADARLEASAAVSALSDDSSEPGFETTARLLESLLCSILPGLGVLPGWSLVAQLGVDLYRGRAAQ
jgi:hypothetical protein